MKLTTLHPLPWRIEYENDVGFNDQGFWEWWEIVDANGVRVAKCDDESTATMLVTLAERGER